MARRQSRPCFFVEHKRDTLPARIGIMRALNAGKSTELEPRRNRAKKHRIVR